MLYTNIEVIVSFIFLAVNMTVHIYVRHMSIHIHGLMGQKKEVFIHQRVFANLVKTCLKPPVPPAPAVMIA
ncbi:hypothetical protein D3C76_1678670 [compost metagenome]